MTSMNRKRLFALGICALLAVALAENGLALGQATEKSMAPGAQKKPVKKAAAKAKAAEEAKPAWMSVSIVKVKPEMVTEWQDLQRNVVIPALRKAGVKQREIWQTATFGDSFEYVIVTPIQSLAQYDNPSPLRTALGEEGFRSYGERSRKCVAGVRTFAIQTRPDLSFEGKTASMTGPPKLAVVTSLRIIPGHTSQFESVIKTDVLPAIKKSDAIGYFVSQTQFGGDANEFTSLILFDSFAQIEKGSPLVRALGQQGYARLLQKTAGVISNVERTIARFNPELSIFPEP